MKVKELKIREVEYIAFRLAKEMMTWDEPIPEFGTRFPNILESCLETPFQTFEKPLYSGLAVKAAILFYLMVKNHPFENGNKRIAVMTLLIFLLKNGKWLDVSNDALYRIAVAVAGSSPKSKDTYLASLKKFVEDHLVNAPAD